MNRRFLVIDGINAIVNDYKKVLEADDTKNQAYECAEVMMFNDLPPESDQPQFAVDTSSQGEEGFACRRPNFGGKKVSGPEDLFLVALTFRGPADSMAVEDILDRLIRNL